MGAMYALIGHKPLLRVAATNASRCNDCADCYAVCPEPRVIPIALKGKGGASPVITDRACTNCGRCIDVCAPDVFRFTHRFDLRECDESLHQCLGQACTRGVDAWVGSGFVEAADAPAQAAPVKLEGAARRHAG